MSCGAGVESTICSISSGSGTTTMIMTAKRSAGALVRVLKGFFSVVMKGPQGC